MKPNYFIISFDFLISYLDYKFDFLILELFLSFTPFDYSSLKYSILIN